MNKIMKIPGYMFIALSGKISFIKTKNKILR